MSDTNGHGSKHNLVVLKNMQGLLAGGRRVTTTTVFATVGTVLTDYVFQKRLAKWQQEDHFHLQSYDLVRGVGRILGSWLYRLHPAHTPEQFADALEMAVARLDKQAEGYEERAMFRLLASKVMIHLEGMKGAAPLYVHFQTQAQELLKLAEGVEPFERGDLFLGKPFRGDALFAKAHRLLQALTMDEDQADLGEFLATWRARKNWADDADYYAYLIALTHEENDETRLTMLIEGWYSQYRKFKIQQIQDQKKWVVSSLAMLSGGLSLESLREMIWGKSPSRN